MKKFILAAVAATLVASPALAAPQGERVQTQTVVKHKANGKTVIKQRTVKPNKTVTQRQVIRPAQANNRSWQRGQRFDSRYARNYRQVDYRQFHGRVKARPRGYRYVQSGNDLVLVSVASGIIGAVLANIFN